MENPLSNAEIEMIIMDKINELASVCKTDHGHFYSEAQGYVESIVSILRYIRESDEPSDMGYSVDFIMKQVENLAFCCADEGGCVPLYLQDCVEVIDDQLNQLLGSSAS